MIDIYSSPLRVEGNTIFIRTNPTVGILTITGLTDDSNPSANFSKRFRYALDGVVFSEWLPLTLTALTSLNINPNNVVVFEIVFERTDPTAQLTQIHIQAADQPVNLLATHFQHSMFAQFFGVLDQELLNWHINVLQKLHGKGLIPNFISRNVEGDSSHFIEFWGSVSKFFAFYVRQAREFSRFYNNRGLVQEFLQQRGLNIGTYDSLSDVQILLESYYRQMKKRGTIGIIDEKADGRPDGELRRLIDYAKQDEFIFLLYAKNKFGWNLRNCSPMHRGLVSNDTLNKITWSKGFVDVQPALNGFAVNAIQQGDGLLYNNTVGSLTLPPMKVSSKLDYILYFEMKGAASVNIEFTGTDAANAPLNFKLRQTGQSQNSLNIAPSKTTDHFRPIRVILYNDATPLSNIDRNNFVSPQGLGMLSCILSFAGYDGLAVDTEIRNIRFTPLLTTYSRGFLDVNQFISTWLINRNQKFTVQELHDYVIRYLINYDQRLKISEIEKDILISKIIGDYNDDFSSDFFIDDSPN